MDKFNAMETFVQIVDKGSMTAAADQLETSLPTVVRTLSALENYLGVRLLNRTTRKLHLTEEGEKYLERCRTILADVADIELALSTAQSEPSGKLLVTAPVMFGRTHVAPIVNNYLQRYNKMKVDLTLSDRSVNLIEEGIDIAVRIGHLADSSMVGTKVGEVRQVLCASPELLERVGAPQHPDDLIDKPCVRMTGLANAPKWTFFEKEKRVSVPINDVFICNQVPATIDACLAGLGFGLFLSYQVMPLVRAGKLRIVLPDYEPPTMPVHVLYSHLKLMSVRVKSFADWIKRDLKIALEKQ